jgi:hypothetical protein
MSFREHAAVLRAQAADALMRASDLPPGREQQHLLAESRRLNREADAAAEAAGRTAPGTE